MQPADVLEHMADGVVVADGEGRVRWVNPAGEDLLARSAGRILGAALDGIVGGGADLAALARRAATENRAIAQDGIRVGAVPVDAAAAPIPGHGVVLTLRDRSLAESLAQDEKRSERIASLATVAAGIAHEVKNPLGGIRGAAQLLSRKSDADAREYLDVIVREVDRIAALVDRLRDLAATEISQSRGPVDVNRLLHELSLLQSATGEAAIELDLDPSLPAVDGDPDALKRLFLNLLRNALEAAKARVHVVTRVETGRRWRDPLGRLHSLIQVAVEDDGPGVAPEHRGKLFEPFFTTKAAGTGLGLAAAQRIAHDHSGTIALEVPAHGGARFVVTLPASLAGGAT